MGRCGLSPKDRRRSVARSVSRIHRSDSASVPMRVATRRPSGLSLDSWNCRERVRDPCQIPGRVDPGKVALPRGRRRGAIDERSVVRQREVNGAIARIVADAVQDHLGRPSDREVPKIERNGEQAARLDEEEAARTVAAVGSAVEDPAPLARLERNGFHASVVEGCVVDADGEESPASAGKDLRPAVGALAPCDIEVGQRFQSAPARVDAGQAVVLGGRHHDRAIGSPARAARVSLDLGQRHRRAAVQ